MGDEIAHDFADDVLRGRTTFTGFCDRLTRQYRTHNANAAPFVSTETFIRWFFAWLAARRIDFRKEIDQSCGYEPKILAVDGTHFGTSVRHLKTDKLNILEADTEDIVARQHTRHSRSFMPYPGMKRCRRTDRARRHLLWKCQKILKHPCKEMTVNEEMVEDDFLMQRLGDSALKVVVSRLIDSPQKSYPTDLRQELARCLADLVNLNTASLVAFLPWQYLNMLKQAFQCIRDLVCVDRHQQIVAEYCPWFVRLLDLALQYGEQSDVCLLLLELHQDVLDIHSADRSETPVEEVPNSYDPSSGVAYYFTPSGYQVRKLPVYEIDMKSGDNKQASLEDDIVEDRAHTCTKKYPVVSRGSYAYIMFFFCPMHGHCYGFHVVPKSEGRKDVFYALLKYLPTAPELLFYDFACSLSQYGLNREPSYFRSIRCSHDIFHAVGHKCPSCFTLASSLSNLSLNTEICEQFNAFIKHVKYTGTHLSFDHFCFFTQFCVYIWNQRKTERHTNRISRQRKFCE